MLGSDFSMPDSVLQAVRDGDSERVNELLQEKPENDQDTIRFLLQETDKQGWTALCHACKKRDLPMIQLLLSRGADRHHADVIGETPFSRAVNRGHLDVLRILLKTDMGAAAGESKCSDDTSTSGIESSKRDFVTGTTAERRLVQSTGSVSLRVSNRTGQDPALQKGLSEKSKHSMKNRNSRQDWTVPPRFAVRFRSLSPSAPRRTDPGNRSISSVSHNNKSAATDPPGTLARARTRTCDVRSVEKERKEDSPGARESFKQATRDGNLSKVKELVHQKDFCCDDLSECYLLAGRYGHFDMARWLVDAGCVPKRRVLGVRSESCGYTVLEWACFHGSEEAVQWLLRFVKVHNTSETKATLQRALRLAKGNHQTNIVRLLLASIQAADNRQSTDVEQTRPKQEEKSTEINLQNTELPLAEVVAIEPIPVVQEATVHADGSATPCSQRAEESSRQHLRHDECLKLLVDLKRIKLTEIQQAIDLAKIFCPEPNEQNKYWKKVFALQEESTTLEQEIASHREM